LEEIRCHSVKRICLATYPAKAHGLVKRKWSKLVPMAKSAWFTLATALCKTIGNTKAKLDAEAIVLGQRGSREGMGSFRQTTGPARFFGAANEVLGKERPHKKG
jgi:hypothetical protein